MSKGMDRRTFVSGAAGAVGIGAVSAISSRVKLAEAREGVDSIQPGVATVPITVAIKDVQNGPKERWKVDCPNVTASAGDDLEWLPGANVAEIVLVAFKGRSPFAIGPGSNKQEVAVLEAGGPATASSTTTGALKTVGIPSGTEGTYSYTIVVKGQSSPSTLDRAFAIDPDLDIVG